MVDISIYNNLRFEYSLGANVLIVSLIDTSLDKSVLKESNVTKMMIEYSFNNKTYTFTKNLSFHINSMIGIIDSLPSNTNIEFTPYLQYFSKTGEELYRIRLTDTIKEKTLPYGNITYDLIASTTPVNDRAVEEKIKDVIKYINGIGSYVYDGYDEFTEYARTIPILDQLMSLYRLLYGNDCLPMGSVWNSKGMAAFQLSHFEEALNCYLQSERILKKRSEESKSALVDIARLKLNIGKIYLKIDYQFVVWRREFGWGNLAFGGGRSE